MAIGATGRYSFPSNFPLCDQCLSAPLPSVRPLTGGEFGLLGSVPQLLPLAPDGDDDDDVAGGDDDRWQDKQRRGCQTDVELPDLWRLQVYPALQCSCATSEGAGIFCRMGQGCGNVSVLFMTNF